MEPLEAHQGLSGLLFFPAPDKQNSLTSSFPMPVVNRAFRSKPGKGEIMSGFSCTSCGTELDRPLDLCIECYDAQECDKTVDIPAFVYTGTLTAKTFRGVQLKNECLLASQESTVRHLLKHVKKEWGHSLPNPYALFGGGK